MFGYVKPCYPDLRMREYEAYRGVYCGVCRSLGKHCGLTARLVLNYDSVFLALLASSYLEGPSPCFRRRRCFVHPLQKKPCCCDGEALRFAGCVYLILVYHKLLDDRADSGFFSSLKSRILLCALRRCYRKAARQYPEADRIAAQCVQAQQRVEESDHVTIDPYAHPTAEATASLCALCAPDEPTARVLRRLGYMLGRWIYILDAADDLAEDRKRRRFNPFLHTLPAETLDDRDAFCAHVEGLLRLTAGELAAAYELLEIQYFPTILQNIIYLGLETVQKQVLYPRKTPDSVSL